MCDIAAVTNQIKIGISVCMSAYIIHLVVFLPLLLTVVEFVTVLRFSTDCAAIALIPPDA